MASIPALASVPQNHIVRRPTGTDMELSIHDINNRGVATFVSKGSPNQGPSSRDQCVCKVEYKPTFLRFGTRIFEQNCKEVAE